MTMEKDDIIYAVLLVISLSVGHLVKSTTGSAKRQGLCCAVGVAMIVVVCREHGLHSLLTAVVNALIVTLISPRWCHLVSFVWCFGYIAFFRTTHYFGLPQVLPHANAVQLFLTLRMVGLAFEIHDTTVNREETQPSDGSSLVSSKSLALRNKYQSINPSFFDILAYSFCYIGLLTGPYYKYRTYHDMLHNAHAERIDTVRPMLRRFVYVPVIATGFLLASHYFSIKYVHSDEFYSERPFWYRVLYMVPMFFIFRTRLYVAWIMSECMCMTAALGAYPAISRPRCGSGPTDFDALEMWNAANSNDKSQSLDTSADSTTSTVTADPVYDFETIHNLDIYGCELAPTVREGMRAWNMSVQYWLATYVYKRFKVKSGPLRVAATMTVSAFWHGVHPGYYLSFLTIPPNLIAEELMAAAFRGSRKTQSLENNDAKNPSSSNGKSPNNDEKSTSTVGDNTTGEKVPSKIPTTRDDAGKSPTRAVFFDWICWFFKMRSFEYMSMSFLLLGFTATLRYWYSIYFIGHLYIAAFIAIGHYYRPRRSRGKSQQAKVE